MFALADCNNFFVSCERVFNPGLNGRPVVVLSNNDGCIVSRSNEAKKLGIKMGVPLFQVRELVQKHEIVVFSSNYVLYGDMSRRVQETLRTFVPAIEIYSIDEAFLDLRGMEHFDLDALAKKISLTCLRHTGIPVSVGVAPTKTLAKVASKLCKQYPKLRGGCYLYKPADIEKVLKTYPIGDVWGIGRQYTKKLRALGVGTAYEFTQLSAPRVQKMMGITGLRTWKELRAEACIEFMQANPPKQQICVSRSFSKEITDCKELGMQVSMFCAMACEKLRKQNSHCHQALVFILTNPHKEDCPRHFESTLISFQVPTSSTLEINRAILQALQRIFKPFCAYKKAGVVLMEMVPDSAVQGSLFDELDREKHRRLMKAVDKINQKNGYSSVAVATQSLEGIKMNRRYLSPQYTTKWSDIIKVKV
ncbi:MAG: Y-family DNA polymerase [Bacteroidales bacterium]|jgi:DNA polymerase V|nr:Y-family DNA polymerase [Bacteroidales bacterium]OQC02601.1 MAG: DNA polymerase IV [Bacteroidetes bacterium ADurb.Bin090]NLV39192.1 Y-family DNA polymerase [Bacteroidales bacterium]HOD25957.1 Y-family DNA polymerase [Bacteroidales bacterium]HPB36368.1 Y-family DNA polymerase [Bacteroidales bacterium]